MNGIYNFSDNFTKAQFLSKGKRIKVNNRIWLIERFESEGDSIIVKCSSNSETKNFFFLKEQKVEIV